MSWLYYQVYILSIWKTWLSMDCQVYTHQSVIRQKIRKKSCGVLRTWKYKCDQIKALPSLCMSKNLTSQASPSSICLACQLPIITALSCCTNSTNTKFLPFYRVLFCNLLFSLYQLVARYQMTNTKCVSFFFIVAIRKKQRLACLFSFWITTKKLRLTFGARYLVFSY